MDNEISTLEAEVNSTKNMVGHPYTATTASAMSDQTKIYVYTGSETGYTAGHWYYHNGTAWTDGGVYNSVAVNTDTSLTVSGQAADSKAVGDAIDDLNSDMSDVKSDLNQTQASVTSLAESATRTTNPVETGADLYICDDSGNVIGKFVNGHFATKNFDSADIGDLSDLTTTANQTLVDAINEAAESGGSTTDIIMDASSSDADLYVCDSFGNVIAEFKNGHIKTKDFDSANIDLSSVEESIDALETESGEIKSDVIALQAKTSGILYRNQDITDGVYAACRWHQPKSTNKQFCMLLSADIHSDWDRFDSIIEYLNAVDAFDAGIMLGDINNRWDYAITRYNTAVAQSQKPFLTIVGNHDTGAPVYGVDDLRTREYTNIHDFYVKYFEPNLPYAQLKSSEHVDDNTYYYKDFDSYKIRVITLNQYDYPPDVVIDGASVTFVYSRGSICFSQNQIDWFCDTLESVPSDYGVIIATHMFPAAITVDHDSIFTSSTENPQKYYISYQIETTNGYIIEDIVNAWVNGTTLAKSYNYVPSGSFGTSIDVSVDYTNRGSGDFITYIVGHLHMSIFAQTTAYGQKVLAVPAATIPDALESDTPRRIGTRSEDNFFAMAVDRDLRKIKVFQIGAHYTKDGIDRQYGQYSY